MVDREKVIKGLEHCVIYADSPGFQACDECPYNDDSGIGTCESNGKLLKDALELLKEQKHELSVTYYWGRFPSETNIKAVKWDGV